MFTDPVTGKNFYDREEYLALLLKRAKGLADGYRQNVAILGEETFGKTSLILQFILKLQENSPRILTIYFDISFELPLELLIKRFIAITLFNLSKLLQKTAYSENDIEELLNHSKAFIPETVEEIKKCFDYVKNNNFTEAYSTMLTVPQLISKEVGIPVILIIEEFHKLERFSFLNPFNELAKKIMISKNVMYIISSSSIIQAKRILSKELSLLFGNFEIVILEPFDMKTSNDFLEVRLSPVKCSLYYRDFISEITDGQPFYLNIISAEIKSIALEKKLRFITDEVIIEALTNLLFDSTGILNQLFTHRIKELPTNRSPLSYTSILLSLAHNCNRIKEIKDYLDTKSEKEFINHLNTMLEMGYIYKNGILYYLNDRLFKFWLTEVYEKKRDSLDIKLETMRENFKKSLQKNINAFLKDRKKSVEERLLGLLGDFGNEVIYLGSHRIKLPRFNKIELKNIDSQIPIITAKTRNKSWIFVVRKGHIDRTVMEEIWSCCNRLKTNKTRKLIIALDGIDEDARLLAKEEKFITLENKELNKLLKLYGKFKIFH